MKKASPLALELLPRVAWPAATKAVPDPAAGRTYTRSCLAPVPRVAKAPRFPAALPDVALVRIVDLAPDRDDGYDLTDWLLDGTPNADAIVLGCAITARSDDGD